MSTVFFSGKFWLNFFLIVGACAFIDLVTYSYDTLFANNLAGTLMVLVKERGGLNDRVDLPDIVSSVLKKYDIYRQEKKEPIDADLVEVSSMKDIGPINEENKPNIDAIRMHRNKVRPFFERIHTKPTDDISPQEVRVSSSRESMRGSRRGSSQYN
jgi:hypothetical protein